MRPGMRFLPSLTHPVGRSIAALYPEPEPFRRKSAITCRRPRSAISTDHFDVRSDTAFGGAFDVMARYSFADRRLFEPFSGPGFSSLPGYGSDVDAPRTEFRRERDAYFLVEPAERNARGRSIACPPACSPKRGASSIATSGCPNRGQNARDAGLSLITVSGYSPLGHEYNNPQRSTTNTIHVADTLTWTRGNHLVKAGFDSRMIRQDAFRDVQARGTLTFTGAFTGNPLVDLLVGTADVHDAGARRQPAASADRVVRMVRAGQLPRASERDALGRTAVRHHITAGRRRRSRDSVRSANRRACSRSARAACRAPVTTPTATTGRHASAPRGPSTRQRRLWCGARTASTTTIRRSPRAKGYISTSHISIFPRSLPRRLGLVTLTDPFPSNFPIPTPNPAFGFQPDLRTPYLHEFNVTLQRQLGSTRVAEMGYVGSRGRNLVAAKDINQPRPSTTQLNLRPDPRFADITFIESRARSEFDSLQARFQQRYAFGCTMLVAYTLGKSMDDASGFFTSAGDPNFPQDSANLDAEWGRSSFDVRHRLSVSFSYDLPFDFTISGIVADAERPAVHRCAAARGRQQQHRPFVARLRRQRSPECQRQRGCEQPRTEPVVQHRGVLAARVRHLRQRRPEHSRRRRVPAMSISRSSSSIPLRGGTSVQLRAEAFNLLNRANFDLPDNFYGSPTFGQILSAGAPRHIQFGARLTF